ncbi:hypothetical protein Shyhy01_42280 [Streptomyces hygroscopicus subsp. hygroscopicus]|nr:hypothetical protein Shyhy01_42280 [Streptomyces hygroscopicus subsp. hygroscopicus]
MPLHEQVPHAEAAEEQGRGQAHQRAAHDEDGNPVVGCVMHRASRGRGAYGAPDSLMPGITVIGAICAWDHPRGSYESRAYGHRHRIKKR